MADTTGDLRARIAAAIGETLAARRTLNEGHDGEPRWVQHRTAAATCRDPDSLLVAYYPGDTSTGGLPAQATLGQIADAVLAVLYEPPAPSFDFSRVDDPEFEERFLAEWERALRGPKRVLPAPLHIEHDAAVAELCRLRTLRLRLPDEAIVPDVHTPERIDAYLRGRGWRVATPGVTAYIWEHPDHPKRETDRHSTRLFMPTSNRGSDYGRRISILASDLAAIYGVGELQVLADIAASTEETAR